jgi:hypothetical protein
MQVDNPCYKSLLFFTTFARSVLKNSRDIPFVVNRIINKCCIKNGDRYMFRDNLNILNGGVMNENVQKKRLYNHDEIYAVISSKIITDQTDPNLKYSLFRNRLSDVKRIIASWHDDMVREELSMHFPIVSSINFTKKEDAFYRSDHDIFKDPHDVALHAMNALWMWSDLFEVIIFESCLIMLSPSTWKVLYENYYNLMESLENNYEINIFVMLCMMKFDACLYMFNFGRGIPASERMHFWAPSTDYADRIISSRFAFALFAHYHAKFRDGKRNVTALMTHLIETASQCSCDFCKDIHNFKNGEINIIPFDTIFDSKTINKIVYFFTVTSYTFALIRDFFGKNAISLMEMIFMGHIDNFDTNYINDNYDFTGVIMFDIGDIYTYDGTRIELNYDDDRELFMTAPVVCVSDLQYKPSIFSTANACVIPILSEMQMIPNIYAYISAYFNDNFLRMKCHQRVRLWPMNDREHDEMIFFRYKHGIGIYFESGLLFDTFFRAFNDAMFFSGKDIEMYDRSTMKLLDMTNSLDISMNMHKDETKEEIYLSKLQNRSSVIVMNHLVDNSYGMMYGENEYERSFVFSKIINKMTRNKIWTSIILPYICHGEYIIDSSTFDIVRFPNIGFNLISSIKCFFSDATQIEKAIFRYDAVKLIESRLNEMEYTYNFADVIQEKMKTQKNEILSMMPLTKRFLFKANQHINDYPDEEYLPLNGFENSTYELCKMIYALCCMDDVFTDEESVHIFMSLRLNDQVDVFKHKILYKNTQESLPNTFEKRHSLISDLFFDIIYASCFKTKFIVPGGSVIPCSSSSDVSVLVNDEIDGQIVHGSSQCISTVSFMQKRMEMDDIYIGCANRNQNTCSKRSLNEMYRFPLPVYVPKNETIGLWMLSDHIDRLKKEKPIPFSSFQKKEFLQYNIPESVLIYLNDINNCKKLSFSI